MKFSKVIVVVSLALLLAGTAQATNLYSLDGLADCDGWQLDGVVRFGSAVSEVTISYVVDLSQGGSVVTSASGQFLVTTDAPWREVPFGVAGTWDQDLCGDYTVTGSATMTYPGYSQTRAIIPVVLVCDCPPGDDCAGTPGFWGNHEWPVDGLTIGGVDMTNAEAMAILDTPVRGDATVILAKHLIAAKLNVASGTDPSIQGVIDAADAFLAIHPIFSRPGGAAKAEALALKDQLVDYNEQTCPEDLEKAAADESSTWSALKNLYR